MTAATPNQLEFIESLIIRQGGDPEELQGIDVNGRHYERLSDLTVTDASAVIDSLLETS